MIEYLQRGTLHESDWSHIDAWSRRSCHIRLQREHPPFTLFLHVAKWPIKSWRPWHVENLLHGPLFLVGSTSYGPTLVHPSVQMCSKHSIASLSCKYKLCSSLCFLVLFFLYNNKKKNKNILVILFCLKKKKLRKLGSGKWQCCK